MFPCSSGQRFTLSLGLLREESHDSLVRPILDPASIENILYATVPISPKSA